MTKSIHPADQANEKLISEAIRFDVCLFLGAGAYDRASVPELADALTIANKMKAHHNNGREPMIYAISKEGRSALVTAKEQITMAATIKYQNDKSNARKRVASLSARFPEAAFEVAAEGKKFFVAARLPADQAHNVKILREQGVSVAVDGKAAPAAKKSASKPAAPRKAAAVATTKSASAGNGKRAAIVAAAEAGKMPTPPDFSAATHARFRAKLDELVKLAKAGDIKGLKNFAINPTSTSPRAMDKYRNLCVTALEARRKAA